MSIILSFCKSNTFFLKTCKSNIFSICEGHTFYLRYIIVIPRFYIYSNIFTHWLCIILLSNSPPFHPIHQSLHWLHFDHFREPSTQSTRTLLLLQKRKLTVPVNLYVFFYSLFFSVFPLIFLSSWTWFCTSEKDICHPRKRKCHFA